MNRIVNYIKNPKVFAEVVLHRCGFIPDELYVRLQFRLHMGYWPRLDSPITLSEKLNWMKLYYHNPLLHKLVDKAEVKEFVSEKIGKDHVVPAIGLWNSVDEIDFGSLPNQFVLKCTHDSGSVVICKDKANFDVQAAKRKLQWGMHRNYFQGKREWAYKDIQPRIIAEPFIPYLGKPDSVEYKITVYNGKVRFITVCTGIAHASLDVRTNDHFTPEWERLNWYAYYKPSEKDIQKPAFMDEMVRMTEALAEGLPQVRVDWYVDNGQIFFGEMTFYTWAGYLKFEPEEWDEKLGSWLELPKEKWV